MEEEEEEDEEKEEKEQEKEENEDEEVLKEKSVALDSCCSISCFEDAVHRTRTLLPHHRQRRRLPQQQQHQQQTQQDKPQHLSFDEMTGYGLLIRFHRLSVRLEMLPSVHQPSSSVFSAPPPSPPVILLFIPSPFPSLISLFAKTKREMRDVASVLPPFLFIGHQHHREQYQKKKEGEKKKEKKKNTEEEEK